jgi:hypothetical protein
MSLMTTLDTIFPSSARGMSKDIDGPEFDASASPHTAEWRIAPKIKTDLAPDGVDSHQADPARMIDHLAMDRPDDHASHPSQDLHQQCPEGI